MDDHQRKKKRQSSSSGANNARNQSSNSRGTSSNALNIVEGRTRLSESLRSVLAHELCLPLLFLLHGKDPNDLEYFQRVSHFPITASLRRRNKAMWGDEVLATAIQTCCKATPGTAPRATALTEAMTLEVNKVVESQSDVNLRFRAEGQSRLKLLTGNGFAKMGLVFSELATDDNSPLAVLEVGMHNHEWWKKLNQGFLYLDLMLKQDGDHVKLGEKPLLLICLTVDLESISCTTQLAVFLCTKRSTSSSPSFRACLLWHDAQLGRKDASASFGKFLRAVADFQVWREYPNTAYEYLSSTCCKVGDKVLRCYDHRVRQSERSPLIYCKHPKIVGGKSEMICCFCETDLQSKLKNLDWKKWNEHRQKTSPSIQYEQGIRCDFWEKRGALLIIAVPYFAGNHRAKSLSAFVPILNQICMLHDNGLVYGDVRGFNAIFTNDGTEGVLIDFDLSGPAEVGHYPEGYVDTLKDGHRREVAGKPLQCWHDIDALVRLIFEIYRVDVTDDEHMSVLAKKIQALQKFWDGVDKVKGPSKRELRGALRDLRDVLSSNYLALEPRAKFGSMLDEEGGSIGTKAGATGSPPNMQGT